MCSCSSPVPHQATERGSLVIPPVFLSNLIKVQNSCLLSSQSGLLHSALWSVLSCFLPVFGQQCCVPVSLFTSNHHEPFTNPSHSDGFCLQTHWTWGVVSILAAELGFWGCTGPSVAYLLVLMHAVEFVHTRNHSFSKVTLNFISLWGQSLVGQTVAPNPASWHIR